MAKFQPGQSGNPKGRPKGTSSALRYQAASPVDLPTLLDQAWQEIQNGDTRVLMWLCDRMRPPDRATAPLYSVPGLKKATTIKGRVDAICDAVADAKLPPDIGSNMISALVASMKAIDDEALLARIEALENDEYDDDYAH